MASDLCFDVVGVGANSVDYVAVLPAFPQPSGPLAKMRLRRHLKSCGGQTATALAGCARLGLRCSYVGATGNDANGRLVRDTLGRLDVDISHLVVHDATSHFAFILLDERTGERIILWDCDERLNLTDDELPGDLLRSCRVVHVDDVDEQAAIAAARIARAHRIPVTSDIDCITGRTSDLIDAVSVAIFAEEVPVQFTGRQDVGEALNSMPRRPDQVLCVTLGSRGAMAVDNDGLHQARGFPVPVVDTTAAGDIFRAGFIYALLRGWTLDEQLRFANAAAAVSCTRLGAIPSVPSLEEVEQLFRSR